MTYDKWIDLFGANAEREAQEEHVDVMQYIEQQFMAALEQEQLLDFDDLMKYGNLEIIEKY